MTAMQRVECQDPLHEMVGQCPKVLHWHRREGFHVQRLQHHMHALVTSPSNTRGPHIAEQYQGLHGQGPFTAAVLLQGVDVVASSSWSQYPSSISFVGLLAAEAPACERLWNQV